MFTPRSPNPSQLPGRDDPNSLGILDAGIMSFGDHLDDLRKRVFFGIVGIIPIFAIAFGFGRPLLQMLIEPARVQLSNAGQGSQLLATGPFETFGAVIQIALIITILLGSPWLLYQLWLFVSPGLYKHERKIIHLLIPFSALLTVLSVLFLYFAVLPVILAFFIGFGAQVSSELDVPTAPIPAGIVIPMIPILEADPENIEIGMVWINSQLHQQRVCVDFVDDKPIISVMNLTSNIGIAQQYRISEYIKMILNMGLAFGVAFQTPVVVVMLGWVGLLNPKIMTKYRRHAIAVSAILGAVMTPADPLSMLLLAGPLYALYELGLFILKVLPIERVLRNTDLRDSQHTDAVTDEDAGDEDTNDENES